MVGLSLGPKAWSPGRQWKVQAGARTFVPSVWLAATFPVQHLFGQEDLYDASAALGIPFRVTALHLDLREPGRPLRRKSWHEQRAIPTYRSTVAHRLVVGICLAQISAASLGVRV